MDARAWRRESVAQRDAGQAFFPSGCCSAADTVHGGVTCDPRAVTLRSCADPGALARAPGTSRHSRHDKLVGRPGSANGSTPSTSRAGEPRIPSVLRPAHQSPRASKLAGSTSTSTLLAFDTGAAAPQTGPDGRQVIRVSSSTGIVRAVFFWYSPRPGTAATASAHTFPRSPPSSSFTATAKVSVPNSTLISGWAFRL